MKHFISFQKTKKIVLDSRTEKNGYADSPESAFTECLRLQAELLKYGYVLNKETFDLLVSDGDIYSIYMDLTYGFNRLFGDSGYEPLYPNFPQSVKELPYEDFVLNAMYYYWTNGLWRPEDEFVIARELALETKKIKEVGHITNEQFKGIFSEIVYSGSSISAFDKECIDYFLKNGEQVPSLNSIPFKETRAYIGKRLFEEGCVSQSLNSATDLLRIYAAWSGGDEGLKTNTKFKQPNVMQKEDMRMLLDSAYDIEESFKSYREVWLRVLYYLNPMSSANADRFPALAKYANDLRNNPKVLRTFNSRIEEAIKNKDLAVFDLLKNRSGVFMRRLNELFGIFGIEAINRFIATNPSFERLVSLYNYFSERGESKGRAVILANQSRSEVKTFDALEAINPERLKEIQEKIMSAVKVNKTGKVFIDRSLYFRPLALNNRAANFSISGKSVGTVEVVPEGNTIRAYVHWTGRSDIDLSGFMIFSDNSVKKIGWNGYHTDKGIVYSGDNTGHAEKNAEYIDITPKDLPDNCEWIVTEARVYRGVSFDKWPGAGVHAGWMLRNNPEVNEIWVPETIEHGIKIETNARNAMLFAVHIPTRNVVYLDVNVGNNDNVGTDEHALQMRVFLDKFIVMDSNTEISWAKLNQGHVLAMLAGEVVNSPEEANIVFDENTTWERVAGSLNRAYLL